jgi:hypothetical protein
VLRSAAEKIPDMGQETMDILEHLVLSHHGKLEYRLAGGARLRRSGALPLPRPCGFKLAAIKEMMDLPNALVWTERVPSLGKPVLRVGDYMRKGFSNRTASDRCP